MGTHLLLAAWFAAALVANGYYQPNLRSWACANGSIEQTYKSNIVGLSKVCVNMVSPLRIFGTVEVPTDECFTVVRSCFWHEFH